MDPIPIIIRPAVVDDSEYLLAMINAGYAISEKFMWKENTVRTNIDDVKSITIKTFLDQDNYLVGSDDGDIVCSIRYEPKIIFTSKNDENITKQVSYRDIFPQDDQTTPNNIYQMLSQSEVYNPFSSHELAPGFGEILSMMNEKGGEWEIHAIGYFSQFVVNPLLQGSGYGLQLLKHIELLTSSLASLVISLIQTNSDLNKDITLIKKATMRMIVLSPRTDMTAYYEKKGYTVTGTLPPEPYMIDDVLPQYADLVELEYGKEVTFVNANKDEEIPGAE